MEERAVPAPRVDDRLGRHFSVHEHDERVLPPGFELPGFSSQPSSTTPPPISTVKNSTGGWRSGATRAFSVALSTSVRRRGDPAG